MRLEPALQPVAVGTAVTRRPPHRSVLEELPHTAPALDTNVEARRCAHTQQPLRRE
jgi:hypothetical protein